MSIDFLSEKFKKEQADYVGCLTCENIKTKEISLACKTCNLVKLNNWTLRTELHDPTSWDDEEDEL